MFDDNWYTIDNIQEVDNPFLAVFPELVKENIASLKKMIPDTGRLRPHVKTHKSKQVVSLLMEQGITKFKCATIAEAEMLALCGVPDVLMAYQPVGPKIKRFIHLMTNYPSTAFSCLADNEAAIALISEAAIIKSLEVNVWLDLNTGMNRTGILPAGALGLYHSICKTKGIHAAGIHAYDGHITNPDAALRKIACMETYGKVQTLAESIENAGLPRPAINTGSSPTLEFYAATAQTECSPGTFIYWDAASQERYPELPFTPAMVLITRIISKPGPETYCLDLGYKALASEGNMQQRVRFLNVPGVQITSQGEEHMVVAIPGRKELQIGEVLYGIPYHIGRTCNLYLSSSVVTKHRIAGQWLHFTGRTLSI